MNRERLLKLADHLETVPEKDFYLGAWAKKKGCGTVCCAMGHAANIPEFKALGLRVEFANKADLYAGLILEGPDGLYDSYYAAAALFDISYSDANYLFEPDEYEHGSETPRDVVIARIRDFAK